MEYDIKTRPSITQFLMEFFMAQKFKKHYGSVVSLTKHECISAGCDRTFCIEENPCSSTVYTKLTDEGRAGREASHDKIDDSKLDHGWYITCYDMNNQLINHNSEY